MESLTFKIEDFEGPLDLLLHLISKNKMDLYDIPILELIQQYTALIEGWQNDHLDIASEFIDMAAQLVQMKSFLLLPRSEEAERMKEELQGQLIEYNTCKQIAKRMGEMAAEAECTVRGPMKVELDKSYTLLHDKELLRQAWYSLMGKNTRKAPPPREHFEPLVATPFVSVASRVVSVLRGMLKGRFHRLQELFGNRENKSESVATFLAVLELIHAGRLNVDENGELSIRRGFLKKAGEEK